MRHAFAAVLVAVSLAAAPVQAAGSDGFIASIPHDFVTGAKFYYETVEVWFLGLLERLGISDKLSIISEGDDCSQGLRCSLDLVCVNACETPDCDVFHKHCIRNPEHVDVLGEYSLCGNGNLCADDTFCTRTCPAGDNCGTETHRCMRPIEPDAVCTSADDCRAACGQFEFPPIGPSAHLASCVNSSCTCTAVEIATRAPRVECPIDAGVAINCPLGTHPGCTPASCPTGECAPYLTCLASPAYGGTCLDDGECSDAGCSENAAPFCDTGDQRCKCRSTEIKTIACESPADCSAVAVCGANEVHACVAGACACAPAGVVTTCSSVSECSSDCPAGFDPACTLNQCVCQRVTENVPVACVSVDDCGGVSCPTGYDKACLDAKCACTRTVTP